MGEIIFWILIRFTLLLFGAWFLYYRLPNYSDWWTLFFVGFVVLVIYPAQVAYSRYRREVRRVSQNALCSTCEHYRKEETLCAITDEHVRRDYTPCEGNSWEPISVENYQAR